MLDIVNGYVCHNCSDIDLAKRNVDPKGPHDPVQAAIEQKKRVGEVPPNPPLNTTGDVGRNVNIFA